jgi:hypothetical protein
MEKVKFFIRKENCPKSGRNRLCSGSMVLSADAPKGSVFRAALRAPELECSDDRKQLGVDLGVGARVSICPFVNKHGIFQWIDPSSCDNAKS